MATISGCVKETYRPRNYAELVISDNYNFFKSRRIAVLPFIVSGEKENTRYTESDKLSTKLMKMGFTVVERTLLEQVFSELKLSLTGAISPDKLKQIGGMLSVDLIVFGTLEMGYAPARGTGEGCGQGAYYFLTSVSVRMVDVTTGEVMVSAYCDKDRIPYGRNMIEEIAESIRRDLIDFDGKKKDE